MFCFQTTILLLILTIVDRSIAGTKSKCDVVRALRAEGVPDGDIRDWLCLVKHESNYRYDAKNVNSGGSTDFGIFQLNDNYSCGKTDGTDTTICWRLNTHGCADTCESMLNSDISNDASCAVRIKNCAGFNRWYGWRDHCSDVSGSAYDYSSC